MNQIQPPVRDVFDDKVTRVFADKVVRKDLVRKIKVGANVPVFVLEYLLAEYYASSDETANRMGLQVVNDTLAGNYIQPDQATKAQNLVKEKARHIHRQIQDFSSRIHFVGWKLRTSTTDTFPSRTSTFANSIAG